MIIMDLKRVVVMKSASIHISRSPSPYPGNMGSHTFDNFKGREVGLER
jgi:hypothetical protein